MWRFAYSGTSQYCEVVSCFSPFCGSRDFESRLTPVVSCTLLMWVVYFLCTVLWDTSPVEVLVDYVLAYVICTDSVYSVIKIGADWGSGPKGGSWGHRSCVSSFQAYLGRFMLEDFLT